MQSLQGGPTPAQPGSISTQLQPRSATHFSCRALLQNGVHGSHQIKSHGSILHHLAHCVHRSRWWGAAAAGVRYESRGDGYKRGGKTPEGCMHSEGKLEGLGLMWAASSVCTMSE